MNDTNDMLLKLSQLEKRKLVLQEQIRRFDDIIKEYQQTKEDIEFLKIMIMYKENKDKR